jgi:putative transposase
MALNLPAPPNFRGLNKNLPVRRYERYLPHWRQDGATYFVTFNLADAIPAHKQREIESIRREWECKKSQRPSEHSWQEYAKTVYNIAERALDAGFGNCWFQKPLYVEELIRSFLHFQEQRYEIGCFVVMKNHCHLVIRPFEGNELEELVGAIKRTTSRFIHDRERMSGALWSQESYDRIIRDEEHLYRVIQYIGNNPIKAGVEKEQWNRWIHPAWERAGWKFHDPP